MGQRNRGGVVTLTNLMTIRKRGREFTYFRRRGHPLVRLPDLPHDHPDFLKAYAEAKKAAPASVRSAPHTLAAHIEGCIAGARYKQASDGYRSILRRHFDAMRAEYGTLPVAGLRQRHIQADVDKAGAPDHRLKAWRVLCAWCVRDARLLRSDPSAGVSAPDRPRSDGHPPWTPDEIAAFRARWPLDTVPRRAMELLFWTGARISDAVQIGPGMIDAAGVLTYAQKKTGDPAHAPWTCTLPAYAAGMSADRQMMHAALAHAARHMTFLATAHGRTRSSKALGTLIRESAREAEVAKSAHGLRKSRAVALAEAGATPHQIAAWTGHLTLAEVERYTRKADRRRAVMGTERDQNTANNPGQMCKPGKLQ